MKFITFVKYSTKIASQTIPPVCSSLTKSCYALANLRVVRVFEGNYGFDWPAYFFIFDDQFSAFMKGVVFTNFEAVVWSM